MKKNIILFLFLNISLLSYSQLINYSFSSTSVAYTANTSATVIVAAGTDVGISSVITIPFTFQYNCQNYTTFQASANGVMFLGTTAASSNDFNDLAGSTDRPALAPLWDDLATTNAANGGQVNYSLNGTTAPNRVLTVEWKSMKWDYSATNANWAISFQCKLYEGTNRIEFTYSRNGNATANLISADASIGISGTTSGDFYSLGDVTATPSVSKVTETTTLASKPATNQVYRWDPVVCSGAPASGTGVATPSANCSNFTTTLSLTGGAIGCGLTYLWYEANAAGGPYTAIGTATTATTNTFAVVSGTPKFFKCVTTCGASSATTAVITASVSAGSAGVGSYSVSLPYVSGAQTTCGSLNDITSTNVANVCGSTSYYGGEDVVYIFTPTVSATFNGSVTSTGSYMGMMLYEGCPTGTGVCVANAQSSSGNQSITSCANMLTAGTTYYLILDSYPSPTCNPYNLNISLSTCSGAPTAGTAAASPSVNCGPFNTTLSLTGNSSSCGITYQWYHSNAAAGTYTAIGTATSTTTQTFAVTTTKYFKCVVTCGASSATTAVISASINPIPSGTGSYSVSLPYVSGAQTTCGNIDDLTSSNVTNVCGSTSYYGGEDVVYVFTPTVTAAFNGSVTSGGSYMGMMLYDGCPTSTGVCVANAQSSSGNQSITSCANMLTAGNTYYLILDSYPSPTCNPYNLNISLSACSGVPIAGTAIASPSVNCGTFTTTLSLTGSSTNCGITYQWYQSNAAAGTYTAISTASFTSTITSVVSSTTFYKCVVTCGASSATTAVISASINPIPSGTGSYSVSLPYTSGAQTTCGNVNDFTSSNVTSVCGSTSYYTGEDVVYIFTPTVTATFNASVTSTGSYVGMMLYSGCPTAISTCLANSQSSSGNQSITSSTAACGSNTLNAGQTYYLIIDSYAAPACNPYNLTMSLTPIGTSTVPTCNMNYVASSTTFSFETLSAPTLLPTTDDVLFTDYIDFGFSICYDGKPYTGGYVASNSSFVFDALPCFPNIQTSTNAAGGVSTGYTISGAAPINGTSVPRNAILAPWHDINPGSSAVVASSKIQYQITGTSPNRKVVISWEDIPMYSGACETIAASRASSQIKIFEFDSSIEIHIKNKQVCASWNGGDAILGLQNYNGTIYIPPVNATIHNYPTNWTMTNTAYKFTALCAGSGTLCLTTLPTGFVNFYGDYVDNVNTLFWQTSTEENLDYFMVERSTDAINFTSIGKVAAKNAASSYTYKDFDNEKGMINYYRIKSVEKNSKSSETNIISIGAANDEILSSWPIYPNPANTNEIFIRLNSKKTGIANFTIYDILGNVVQNIERQIEPGVKVYDVDISKLSLGIYYFEVKNSFNEAITKQKLIINK